MRALGWHASLTIVFREWPSRAGVCGKQLSGTNPRWWGCKTKYANQWWWGIRKPNRLRWLFQQALGNVFPGDRFLSKPKSIAISPGINSQKKKKNPDCSKVSEIHQVWLLRHSHKFYFVPRNNLQRFLFNLFGVDIFRSQKSGILFLFPPMGWPLPMNIWCWISH